MIIKEFNFFIKSSQNIDTLKSSLLDKLNAKCDTDTGYISNIYDTFNKKKYLLVSDNIKNLNNLDKNLFEFDKDIEIKDIDLSEYYTKIQSDARFATKGEIAKIQAGEDIDLAGYLSEEKALELFASKADLESQVSKVELEEKLKEFQLVVNLDDYYTKNEIEEKLSNIDIPEANLKEIEDKIAKSTEIDKVLKQAIKDIYNVLYRKILEVEKFINNDEIPIEDSDIPEVYTPLFNDVIPEITEDKTISKDEENNLIKDDFIMGTGGNIVILNKDKSSIDDVIIFD